MDLHSAALMRINFARVIGRGVDVGQRRAQMSCAVRRLQAGTTRVHKFAALHVSALVRIIVCSCRRRSVPEIEACLSLVDRQTLRCLRCRRGTCPGTRR